MNKEQLQAICEAANISFERFAPENGGYKDGYHIWVETYDWNGHMEPHGIYHLQDMEGTLYDIQSSRIILKIQDNRRLPKQSTAIQGPPKNGRKEGSKNKAVTVAKRHTESAPTLKAKSKPQVHSKPASQDLMKQRAEAFLAKKQQYQCGACGELGHNARTCGKKG